MMLVLHLRSASVLHSVQPRSISRRCWRDVAGWSASCGRAVGVEHKFPTHTIISLAVHAAVWEHRADGASLVVVAVQPIPAADLHLPPVFKSRNAIQPTPYDHLDVGPDRGVRVPGAGA